MLLRKTKNILMVENWPKHTALFGGSFTWPKQLGQAGMLQSHSAKGGGPRLLATPLRTLEVRQPIRFINAPVNFLLPAKLRRVVERLDFPSSTSFSHV